MSALTVNPSAIRRTFCVLFTLLAWLPTMASSQEAGVRLRIRIDAESVEVLRAWRRANHLDPPDAEADAKLRERLASRAPYSRDAATAARERRRMRTVELLPIAAAQEGIRTGACTAFPAETDPCTIVVQYRP